MIKYSKITDNIGSGNFTDTFWQNTNKFEINVCVCLCVCVCVGGGGGGERVGGDGGERVGGGGGERVGGGVTKCEKWYKMSRGKLQKP